MAAAHVCQVRADGASGPLVELVTDFGDGAESGVTAARVVQLGRHRRSNGLIREASRGEGVNGDAR